MADYPQKPGRERPLSPHLTIWRWQVTMLASIMHRATGMALAAGMVVFVVVAGLGLQRPGRL